MRGADSVAGMIKSGGTTRRAAKMVVLNIDHPDILEFVQAKAKEEKKSARIDGCGLQHGRLERRGVEFHPVSECEQFRPHHG
jgi:ribonucleoside-diphosphate reductase alpha chain